MWDNGRTWEKFVNLEPKARGLQTFQVSHNIPSSLYYYAGKPIEKHIILQLLWNNFQINTIKILVLLRFVKSSKTANQNHCTNQSHMSVQIKSCTKFSQQQRKQLNEQNLNNLWKIRFSVQKEIDRNSVS